MKQKNLKKKLKGRKPATKSQMVVKYFVDDVEVVYENLSDDCSLSYEAERELRTLKGKVSQHLLMLLRQQLEQDTVRVVHGTEECNQGRECVGRFRHRDQG